VEHQREESLDTPPAPQYRAVNAHERLQDSTARMASHRERDVAEHGAAPAPSMRRFEDFFRRLVEKIP